MEITFQTEPPSEILQDENCKRVMAYNPDNKRSSYRIKINSPVTLKTKSFTEIHSQSQNVQTINLSEGGLCISLNSRIELPSPLLCEFTLLNSPLQFQGKIVWEKIFDDGKYYCGVHFLDKDDQQESALKRFLYTDDEYILNLVKDLKTEDREVSDKIESFFRRDVKWFIEGLIDLEQHIKNKTMSEDAIFERLTNISDEIVKKGDEVEKLVKNRLLMKKIKEGFRSLVGHWVYKSKIVKMSLKESYGYTGNYMTLEIIYDDQPISDSLGFYYDRYFLSNPYAIAVRNRKERMKDLLMSFLKETGLSSINILNLASGPCREIKELIPDLRLTKKKLNFTCVDFDENAISFSKEKLMPLPENIKVELLKENILRLIVHKEPTLILKKQNLIYSIGLADYLSDTTLKRMISFAFSLLNPGGKLIIAHKDRDKYKPLDPDWFCDWTFEPRNVKSLIKLVEDSGIKDFAIDMDWEDSNKVFFLILTKKD